MAARIRGVQKVTSSLIPIHGPTCPGVWRSRFVLHLLDNPTRLKEEPDLAAHKAAALKEAR